MMNDSESKLILTLLIINKGEPLNNSYSLTRVLEWKFKELNSKKILDEIKEKYYAKHVLIHGVHHYELVSKGKELINHYRVSAMNFLLEHYLEESSYITTVFG